MRVIALVSDEIDCFVGDVDADVVLGEHLLHTVELHPHHFGDLAFTQVIKDNDVVNTVQELGPHHTTQFVHHRIGVLQSCADVGGHDDDGVLEVNGTALVVGESSIVEHLQQDVEDVGVRFLDLVKKDDGIGLTPYGLGELSTLFVPHISWRRTDQTRDGVTFLVFRHVDTHHVVLVVEQELGQGFGQLCLTDAGGSHEDERADWPFGVLQSGTAASDGVGDGVDGLVLANDTLVQLVFQVEEFLALALHHLLHGNARPTRHDLGHVLIRHLLIDQRMVALRLLQVGFGLLDGSFCVADLAIAQLCDTAVVTIAFGHSGLMLVLLDVVFLLLDDLDEMAFFLPFCLDLGFLCIEFVQLLGQLVDLLGVVLAFQCLAFDLKLSDVAFHILEVFRH